GTLVCGPSDLSEEPFRLSLDLERDRLAADAHHERIAEFLREPFEPTGIRNRVVVEISDDVCARDERSTIAGTAQSFLYFTYVAGFPLARDCLGLGVAAGGVDDDEGKAGIVLPGDSGKTAVELHRPPRCRDDDGTTRIGRS